MRRSVLPVVLVVAGLALVLMPAPASGHPPGGGSGDWHFSCLAMAGEEVASGSAAAPARVQETLSYVAPLGTSLPCAAPGESAEWGSHVRLCHAPPFLGPRAGAYCGPVVPSGLAGGAAVCTWNPVSTSVPTGLVVGFEAPIASVSLGDGLVRHTQPGEERVFGPYPPGTWRVPNPLPVMGRVLAFPTNLALPPDPLWGVSSATDASEVVCVATVG